MFLFNWFLAKLIHAIGWVFWCFTPLIRTLEWQLFILWFLAIVICKALGRTLVSILIWFEAPRLLGDPGLPNRPANLLLADSGRPDDSEHSPLQEIITSGSPILVRQTILRIMNDININTSKPSILVGGASLMLYGSTRITTDIDLLVSTANLDDFTAATEVALEGQDLRYIDHIDLLLHLTNRFEPVNMESVRPFAVELEGVNVPALDVLLGGKVTSHYGRPDTEEGAQKKNSDLSDIDWISQKMKKRNLQVRKEVCDMFVCGPYNMWLVVENLYTTLGRGCVEVFEFVGGREFECDWGNDEFAEQAEIYQADVEGSGYQQDVLKILQSRREPN